MVGIGSCWPHDLRFLAGFFSSVLMDVGSGVKSYVDAGLLGAGEAMPLPIEGGEAPEGDPEKQLDDESAA